MLKQLADLNFQFKLPITASIWRREFFVVGNGRFIMQEIVTWNSWQHHGWRHYTFGSMAQRNKNTWK